jgi:hypothetical protein
MFGFKYSGFIASACKPLREELTYLEKLGPFPTANVLHRKEYLATAST